MRARRERMGIWWRMAMAIVVKLMGILIIMVVVIVMVN